MRVFETPAALDGHVGQLIGTSGWVEITQARIDLFAEATGDHQWIHTDPERAAREMPGGRTIAHGYLLTALFPVLFADVFSIRNRSRAINYGSDKVRYLQPVPVGARVRLAVTLRRSEPVPDGRRFVFESTMELEGSSRPALFAETISISYN